MAAVGGMTNSDIMVLPEPSSFDTMIHSGSATMSTLFQLSDTSPSELLAASLRRTHWDRTLDSTETRDADIERGAVEPPEQSHIRDTDCSVPGSPPVSPPRSPPIMITAKRLREARKSMAVAPEVAAAVFDRFDEGPRDGDVVLGKGSWSTVVAPEETPDIAWRFQRVDPLATDDWGVRGDEPLDKDGNVMIPQDAIVTLFMHALHPVTRRSTQTVVLRHAERHRSPMVAFLSPRADTSFTKRLKLSGRSVVEGAKPRLIPDDTLARMILRDVTRSLQRVHDGGGVHKDLKPENLLCVSERLRSTASTETMMSAASSTGSSILERLEMHTSSTEGGVVLSDWGLSHPFSRAMPHMQNPRRGTPNYMSPDYLCRHFWGIPHEVLAANDAWSLGVTVLEILASRTMLPVGGKVTSLTQVAMAARAIGFVLGRSIISHRRLREIETTFLKESEGSRSIVSWRSMTEAAFVSRESPVIREAMAELRRRGVGDDVLEAVEGLLHPDPAHRLTTLREVSGVAPMESSDDLIHTVADALKVILRDRDEESKGKRLSKALACASASESWEALPAAARLSIRAGAAMQMDRTLLAACILSRPHGPPVLGLRGRRISVAAEVPDRAPKAERALRTLRTVFHTVGDIHDDSVALTVSSFFAFEALGGNTTAFLAACKEMRREKSVSDTELPSWITDGAFASGGDDDWCRAGIHACCLEGIQALCAASRIACINV
jgi:serine/threonine protein kinase